jgi:hypothetical protein
MAVTQVPNEFYREFPDRPKPPTESPAARAMRQKGFLKIGESRARDITPLPTE